YWLSKLYTKLLWFFVLLLGSAVLSARQPIRKLVLHDPRIRLALWMGLMSLLSLLKSQASHFVFPGAAFLSFFMAQTLYHWWKSKPGRRTVPLWIPAAAAVAMSASVWLYRPDVLARFVGMRDFSEEDRMAARLDALARPEDRVLFL